MGKGKPRHPKPKTGEEAEDAVHQWFSTYFCGCGDSDSGMETFREIMGWFERRGDYYSVNLDRLKDFEQKHGVGLLMVLLYLLGGTGLSEHGGSVYGSWLTGLGATVKEFIENDPDYKP